MFGSVTLACVCVCVCACVRACVRACVSACARACLRSYLCVCTILYNRSTFYSGCSHVALLFSANEQPEREAGSFCSMVTYLKLATHSRFVHDTLLGTKWRQLRACFIFVFVCRPSSVGF